MPAAELGRLGAGFMLLQDLERLEAGRGLEKNPRRVSLHFEN
jgi:hypothetical protein